MTTLGVTLDQHTSDRLDAVMLLLKETDPEIPWNRLEVLRRCVDEGSRILLGELLAKGRRRSHRPFQSLHSA